MNRQLWIRPQKVLSFDLVKIAIGQICSEILDDFIGFLISLPRKTGTQALNEFSKERERELFHRR